MKKIIHLSDLHFGTERPGLISLLSNEIKSLQPDIIIISGDITQRARKSQFYTAKKFLEELNKFKILCVPGNHDISLYNPIERFLYPFAKYKKWVSNKLTTPLIYENLVILGINSVTPYKPMGGYLTETELLIVKDFFSRYDDNFIKVIVMHHNLIRSERHDIINDSEKIIEIFSQLKINLVLSGHIHQPCVELLKHNNTKNLYVVTAGTAVSTRTILPNSFNIIEIDQEKFIITIKSYENHEFVKNESKTYLF